MGSPSVLVSRRFLVLKTENFPGPCSFKVGGCLTPSSVLGGGPPIKASHPCPFPRGVLPTTSCGAESNVYFSHISFIDNHFSVGGGHVLDGDARKPVELGGCVVSLCNGSGSPCCAPPLLCCCCRGHSGGALPQRGQPAVGWAQALAVREPPPQPGQAPLCFKTTFVFFCKVHFYCLYDFFDFFVFLFFCISPPKSSGVFF